MTALQLNKGDIMNITQWDKSVNLNKSDMINLYLTWVNDYLTLDMMADNYGMSKDDLLNVLIKGRKLNKNDWENS